MHMVELTIVFAVSRFTEMDRNRLKQTETDQNGPEWTETDLRKYRNGPRSTETDLNKGRVGWGRAGIGRYLLCTYLPTYLPTHICLFLPTKPTLITVHHLTYTR